MGSQVGGEWSLFSGTRFLSHAAEVERLCQEEEKRQEEELKKLEGMDESERIDYLRKKEQEEEDRRNKEEERKRKDEEAALQASEVAQLQAQLLARYWFVFTAQYDTARLESLVKRYQAASGNEGHYMFVTLLKDDSLL